MSDSSEQSRLDCESETDDYPSLVDKDSSQNTEEPHSSPLHDNIEIYISSPLSDSSEQCRPDCDFETNDCPSFTDKFSSQNTYEPYTDKSTCQSTSLKSTIDDDSLLTVGGCIMGGIIVLGMLALRSWR